MESVAVEEVAVERDLHSLERRQQSADGRNAREHFEDRHGLVPLVVWKDETQHGSSSHGFLHHAGSLVSQTPYDPSVAWSVLIVNLTRGEVLLERDPRSVLKTASVAKVFVLTEVAARAESGRLDLGATLARDETPEVRDSGLWWLLRQPELTIDDIATLVGAVSDNWATNVLIERLGLDAIQQRARSLGFTDTALFDIVRDERDRSHPETLSRGNATDWVSVLSQLAHEEWVSPGVSAHLTRWLSASVDHSMVASALCLDPLVSGGGTPGIRFANKTGSDAGVRADIGWVSAGEDFVYACIANWDPAKPDLLPHVMAEMRSFGSQIAARVGA